jgi:hypothetical protein
METIFRFEISFQKTIWRHIPEDRILKAYSLFLTHRDLVPQGSTERWPTALRSALHPSEVCNLTNFSLAVHVLSRDRNINGWSNAFLYRFCFNQDETEGKSESKLRYGAPLQPAGPQTCQLRTSCKVTSHKMNGSPNEAGSHTVRGKANSSHGLQGIFCW